MSYMHFEAADYPYIQVYRRVLSHPKEDEVGRVIHVGDYNDYDGDFNSWKFDPNHYLRIQNVVDDCKFCQVAYATYDVSIVHYIIVYRAWTTEVIYIDEATP